MGTPQGEELEMIYIPNRAGQNRKVTSRGNLMRIYEISATTIDHRTISLEEFRGKVLLIVNVASKCGFTGQYKGLEALYQKYRDRGFEVLGFPCNQFGYQEPGDDTAIQQFCTTKYHVTFPMFAKIDVNGTDAHPLYRFLKKEKPGLFWTQRIKWNFTKFLVNRSGVVIGRYSPTTSPVNLESAIESALAESVGSSVSH
jgi:glutathione peroxidase